MRVPTPSYSILFHKTFCTKCNKFWQLLCYAVMKLTFTILAYHYHKLTLD